MKGIGIIAFTLCFISGLVMFSTASGGDKFSVAFCGIGLYFIAKGIFLLGYTCFPEKKSKSGKRQCPYCAQWVNEEARICPFCKNEFIDSAPFK